MAKAADIGLLEKASSAATKKASEMAGGYLGEKAGEAAAEAIERYGPTLRRRMDRSLAFVKENPGQTAMVALVTLAVVAGAAATYLQLREK